MRKVEVVPHHKKWLEMFERESEMLNLILGSLVTEIHHIGSTAIATIKAKPVIDILIEVKDIYKVDSLNDRMKEIGYEVMGENGIVGRRFFMKGGNNRTHHVHIFEMGSIHIVRHIAFRDYMIAHPDEAMEYSKLKERLAKQFPTDIESYIKGKNNYIIDIERKALEWLTSLPQPNGED